MQKTVTEYQNFLKRVENEIMSHEVIHNNLYTRWFAKGDFSLEQTKHFVTQFSVFSNLFIIAQLKKVINSESLEEMHRAKEILLNELGVIFNHKVQESESQKAKRAEDSENLGDPEVVVAEGTIEGGTFRFKAAHFEWLLVLGKSLNLGFNDLGKAKHGTKTTLHFTDALADIYGSDNFSTAAGASYAVENWAAAGFWKELIQGLKIFRERHNLKLPLAFFTWHDKVEEQHATHTQDELKEIFYYEHFDEDEFIRAGQKMLDACLVFWNGLDADRQKVA